jgi:predicted PurR-regulated permease PerM
MLGIFYAIGLSWAGIDYGLLVGLTTGLLAFVPIVGWMLGLIFAAGLAIVQFWPDPAPLLKAVAVLVAGIAIDTAFLSPRFVGQKVGLHPVWMIFALFVFSYLFGLVGTLVAVPLAAARCTTAAAPTRSNWEAWGSAGSACRRSMLPEACTISVGFRISRLRGIFAGVS